jgi:hypothetical protein
MERIESQEDLLQFLAEREHVKRLRDAIGFCKDQLEITATADQQVPYEQRVGFEKCLTQNFLLKYGNNYFGKRDLIYLDLYGTRDVENLRASV